MLTKKTPPEYGLSPGPMIVACTVHKGTTRYGSSGGGASSSSLASGVQRLAGGRRGCAFGCSCHRAAAR